MAWTQKKEQFSLLCSDPDYTPASAYREVYNAEKMKPETIWKRSSELYNSGEVQGRLAEIRKEASNKAALTLENHLARLDHLSRLAEEKEQYSAAIKAEESRGKAAGLYTEKVDHTSSDGSMSPKGKTLDDFYNDVQAKPES